MAKKRRQNQANRKDIRALNRAVTGGTRDLEAGQDLFTRFVDQTPLSSMQDEYKDRREANLNSLRGAITPETSTFAGRRSLDTADILNRMKGGLEGYTAAENNAFREAMSRELDTQLRTNLERIRDTNASNLVLGGAAAAREDAMVRQDQKSRAMNEQDLFIRNVDEKKSRLADYAGAIGKAEADEYSKTRDAEMRYADSLAAASKTSMDLQAENIGIEKTNKDIKVSGLTGFTDFLNAKRADERNNRLAERFARNREI